MNPYIFILLRLHDKLIITHLLYHPSTYTTPPYLPVLLPASSQDICEVYSVSLTAFWCQIWVTPESQFLVCFTYAVTIQQVLFCQFFCFCVLFICLFSSDIDIRLCLFCVQLMQWERRYGRSGHMKLSMARSGSLSLLQIDTDEGMMMMMEDQAIAETRAGEVEEEVGHGSGKSSHTSIVSLYHM